MPISIQPKQVWLGGALLLVALASGGFYLVLQTSHSATATLTARLPGMDQQTPVAAAATPFANGRLQPGPGVPAPTTGGWPCFRGSHGDNIATGNPPLAQHWKELWRIDLGEGYAGAAVRNGRVYILDYDQAQQTDALRCLSLADGQEIWRFSYPVKIKRNHGMSRTIPTVTDRYVVALGPKCHVICLAAQTGQFQWGLDLVKEFNVEVPQWYAGQCPLVDGDRVILGTGGDALLIAVELATGKVLWKTPNPHDWKMTHSSVVPIAGPGQRQYVYCGSGGVAGFAAGDGHLLWETDAWQISIATIPSPVPVGADRIFLSGGYNAGSLMLRLVESVGKIEPRVEYRLPATEFGSTQQTPILYQDHIYGVRPDGQFACLDLTGKTLWASGGTARFGLGPYLIAGTQILALNDDGWLTLADATPAAYHPLARARILTGHDAWAPLAFVDGRLLARDLTQLVCLDMVGRGVPTAPPTNQGGLGRAATGSE